MIQACPTRLDCICDENPFQNLSIEAPDRRRFYKQFWASRGCRYLCISEISQEDADNCARFQALLCTTDNQPLVGNDPITITVTCTPQPETYTVDLTKILCCIGEAVNQPFQITGGHAPFTWTLANSLPAGLSISYPDNGRSMVISGTPTAAGNQTLQFSITDGTTIQISKTLDIQVVAIIDTSPLPPVQEGVAYNYQFQATGGNGNYAFTVQSGALPPGLTLSIAGLLQGIPTTAGIYSFSVGVESL